MSVHASAEATTWLLILGVFMLLVAPVHAGYSLQCEKVWAGPSKSNDMLNCILQRLSASDFQVQFGAALFFIALVVASTVIYIPFFVIRQCCNGCGARLMRPGTFCCGGSEWDDKQALAALQYRPSTILCYRIFVVIVFILTFATVGVMVHAALSLENAVTGTANAVLNGAISFVNTTVGDLQSVLKVNGSYVISGIEDSSFSSVTTLTSQLGDFKALIASSTRSGLSSAIIAVAVVSVIPTLTAIFAILLMACSARTCLPALCTCWSFFFLVLFALVSGVLFVVSTGAFIVEGEANLGLQGKPGVVTWWVVPYCESVSPIAPLIANANQSLRNASIAVCDALLSICDNATAFNASTTYVFRCNLTNATVSTLCTTPAAVKDVMSAAVAKGAICNTSACTFNECPSMCNDTSIANQTKNAIDAINLAVNVATTLNRVSITLSCNSLLSTLIGLFNFSALTTSVVLVSVGLGWGAVMFVCLIVLFFKGQKLNLSTADSQGSSIGNVGAWANGTEKVP